MIAAAALLVLIASARADPPPKGWFGSFSGQYIVCDTKDEIRQIAEAGKDDGAKLVAEFKKLADTKNDKGERACVLAPVEEMAVGESEYIGIATAESGTKAKTYAIHIGNQAGEWWMMFGEQVAQSDLSLRSMTTMQSSISQGI